MTYFSLNGFAKSKSVPLTTPRIWWGIFLPKQIFSVMYRTGGTVCKISKKYYSIGKYAFNRRTSVSRKLLIQSSWKFQGIYSFRCSIKPHKTQVNILSLKVFRKPIPYGIDKSHIPCESSSSAKMRPFAEKISGYMQF